MAKCAMPADVFGRREALCVLALGGAIGCTSVERARQCRDLADSVNPRLDQIQELSASSQGPAELRSIAGVYDAIADDLGPLEFQSRALARAVKDYGRHLRALAEDARKAAAATEAGSSKQFESARRDVKRRTEQLKTASQRIVDACR